MRRIDNATTTNKSGILPWSFSLALLFAVFLAVPFAYTQILYGTLTGTISDASNAAVPNEPVTSTRKPVRLA